MLGGMQDFELRVPRLLDHAAREHAARKIVTHWADGGEGRTTWSGIARDARKFAQALERLGIAPCDRVATLAMNHAHHLVAWYGTIGMGGVVHTINPRLFDDQLTYIANHAEDRVLLYDKAFQPIVDRLKPTWTAIEHYIAFDDGSVFGTAWISAMPPAPGCGGMTAAMFGSAFAAATAAAASVFGPTIWSGPVAPGPNACWTCV